MPEHQNPDCTGTWELEPHEDRPAELRCTRCPAQFPATAEHSIEAVRENLLSISLIVMGLAGRLS
jgi:hypothetical protein